MRRRGKAITPGSPKSVYAGQLDLPEAMVQAAQLIDCAQAAPTALLCFEREPGGCHRTLLIDAVMPEADVVHLFA